MCEEVRINEKSKHGVCEIKKVGNHCYRARLSKRVPAIHQKIITEILTLFYRGGGGVTRRLNKEDISQRIFWWIASAKLDSPVIEYRISSNYSSYTGTLKLFLFPFINWWMWTQEIYGNRQSMGWSKEWRKTSIIIVLDVFRAISGAHTEVH